MGREAASGGVVSRELEVENAVLAACLRNRDTRLGRGHGYLSQEVNTIAPSLRVHAQELMEAIWRLVSMGLVYLDFEQPATENWSARLTDRGRKAASKIHGFSFASGAHWRE